MKSIAETLGDVQLVFDFYYDYQKYFFDEPTKEHILLINVLKIINEENIFPVTPIGKKGRPKVNRKSIYRAFIAYSVLQLASVRRLIERLKADRNLKRICGFDHEDCIPSESTFSRAFSEFCENNFNQIIHETIIKEHLNDKIVGHINRDSTAISCREKPINTKRDVKSKPKRKRGRPKKGEAVVPTEPKVIDKQVDQSAREAIEKLTLQASWGSKMNSLGKYFIWKGYKLHLDVTDFGIPVTAILTGANVHDSQLAIPLEKLTSSRCIFLYSLMDSAYDSMTIKTFIKSNGRVPVIDNNKRRKEKIEFDPAKKERYKIRSTVERSNSHLKDCFFGKSIFVKGYKKVSQLLMFGVIALTAVKILQYYC